MIERDDLEFKSRFTEKMAKTVVAFSNCKGGTILVGVDDDGNAIGLDDVDAESRRCTQMLIDDVRPDVTPTTSTEIIEMGGKSVVRIQVREGPEKPYFLRSKGLRAEGVFVREGSMTVPVTEEGFNSMIREIRSTSYEMSISFEQDLTFDYMTKVFEEKGLPLDDGRMKQLGLTRNGQYTNLGLMMSDQFDMPIKAASFPDESRVSFNDRHLCGGSVLQQYDEALVFVRRNNRLKTEIVGTRRIDTRAFPEEAVREAIANAIVHRDYTSTASTLLSIYPRRFEIASPGRLIEGLTHGDIMRGASALRNPRLAAIFYRLELIEAYGTGIPRIMGAFIGADVRPVIDDTGNIFRVSIPSIIDDGDIISEMRRLADDDGTISRTDLEKSLGLSKSGAVQTINGMVMSGRLQKVGSGRSTRYRIIG